MNFVDLKLSRTIKAKPGDVYDVWLDAKALADHGSDASASS
jgi:hypothetical protein